MLDFTWDGPTSDTVGGSDWTFMNEDGTPRTVETLPSSRVMKTCRPVENEVVGVVNTTGQRWWLLISARPRFRDGNLIGVVSSFTDVTRDRNAAQALRAQDARFRAAQELTGLAWWALDPATGRHEWSEQMFRLMGLEPGPEAPDHAAFLELLHPDDRPAAPDPEQAQTTAEFGFSTGHREVFRVVHPDGSVHHLQSWTDVETDADGVVTRVHGATIDVTEREEAVASLSESRSRMAAALKLTNTGTWDMDFRTGVGHWSDRMCELMGVPHGEWTEGVDEYMALVHPDDRERMREFSEGLVTTGRRRGEAMSYRVVHKDGSVHHLQSWSDVRLGEDGEVLAVWGTAMDITEQAEAAARLEASEQHFRVAFDNAPIGMSMISLAPGSHGTYLRANEAFERMIGYTSEELCGQPLLDLTHPDDVERDAALFGRLSRGEIPSLAFEKRYLRKDGTPVHAWLTTSVGFDAHGEPLYLVSHAVDITDRLREQAELERLALTDTLTGLANRTLLDDRLDQALARLQRTGGAAAMLLLDVDRFKLVNDSMGHLVGDALLVEMAGRIQAVSRADATVARLGGDEFVVLVEGLKEVSEVHAIATRLLETLRRPYQLGPSNDSFVATVSLGVSVATSADRSHVDLYREADLALYRAKDAGRDQYALFDDALRSRAVARMKSESLLRRALTEDRLLAVFQPMVDLTDGATHAAEGLARIAGPDGELIPPSEFIDVAEETGLIVEVDARMFELVTAEYARLSALPGINLRRMTTNVSARSLEDPTFTDRLRRALQWYDVKGSAIRIELTERSLLTTSPVVRESLERIGSLGVKVGLDDFGTGYSALAYLQRFSLRFLKIDRSFVSRLGVSLRDDAVVGAVIDLAHAHDLQVIGEGVETPEQLASLRALGCDSAQGYLMGRPMRSADFEALLRTDVRW